ncbi:MAG: hypothetical protein NUW22_05165 [Acidobacteria bacterium]|nr:hypothetical protein [Acidobacteriota bacterium]
MAKHSTIDGEARMNTNGDVRYVYCSFCDPDRPKGTRFLGAAIVVVPPDRVADVRERHPEFNDQQVILAAALQEAHAQGCNPGGEVLSAEITVVNANASPGVPINCLLSREEVMALKP